MEHIDWSALPKLSLKCFIKSSNTYAQKILIHFLLIIFIQSITPDLNKNKSCLELEKFLKIFIFVMRNLWGLPQIFLLVWCLSLFRLFIMNYRRLSIYFLHLKNMIKNLPAMQKTWVQKDSLKKGMSTHSSILA